MVYIPLEGYPDINNCLVCTREHMLGVPMRWHKDIYISCILT